VIYLSAALVVVSFLFFFEKLGVARAAGRAIETSRAASPIMRDPEMSDDEKEAAMRKASVSLLADFGSILLRGAATLALSAVPALVLGFLGLASFEDTMLWLASWPAIIGITVAVSLFYYVRSRR
jgi:hypothetical protein